MVICLRLVLLYSCLTGTVIGSVVQLLSVRNLNLHLIVNQIKFLLWESESNLNYRLLASNRKTLGSAPSHQLLHGFSVQPQVNYILHALGRLNTILHLRYSDINFYELCAEYQEYKLLYTDGSKMGDRVASAVVWQKSSKLLDYQTMRAYLEQNSMPSLWHWTLWRSDWTTSRVQPGTNPLPGTRPH